MALFGKTTKEEKKDEKKKDATKKASMKDLYGEKGKQGTKTEVSKTDKKTVSAKLGQAYKILVKPLITEKASILGQENKYVFEVDIKANKIEVAKAIEEVYKIKPVSVNTVQMIGKKVRTGRYMGKRKDWKKAIITLPKGKTINIYEGV